MRNIDFVILAGGKGSRIRKYLGKYPKPMLSVNNKHFIQYIINKISKYNVKRIIILCGFRYNILFKKYHNKRVNFVKITCLKEKKLMGTAGALKNLKKMKVKDFVLLNGDTFFDIDIKSLISNTNKKSIGSIALTKNLNQSSIKLNNLGLKNGYVYLKKKSFLMNGGIYYFKKEFFKHLRNEISLENDLLIKLINKNLIKGKKFDSFFIDIGSPKYLKLVKNKITKHCNRPAAFLDRDGVINYDYNHVIKFKDFKLREGVIKGLKYLIKKNYYIFVVTNQAGIGKNLFSEEDFIMLHKSIKEKLGKSNVYLNDVQYSPFHPNAKLKKFRKKSRLRKPDNKMIENIFNNWDIDAKKSFMIGDQIKDFLCAKKSKLRFFYAKKNFFLQIKNIINNY